MTDYRTRNRGSSIFSDDDRRADRWRSADYGWGGNPGRGAEPRRETPDDRGFFEKAGDEVRSWFGDDDAERRRELDARQGGREPGTERIRQRGDDDRWAGRDTGGGKEARDERGQWRTNQAPRPGSPDDVEGGFGDGGFGGARQAKAGRSGAQDFGHHHDETYRRWRDEQIAALDREYDAYRSHRQQQFEQDFSTFRQSRQSQITSGGATLGQTGGADTAQISTRATGPGETAQQSDGDLTTGTETVTAEPAGESEGRSARNR